MDLTMKRTKESSHSHRSRHQLGIAALIIFGVSASLLSWVSAGFTQESPKMDTTLTQRALVNGVSRPSSAPMTPDGMLGAAPVWSATTWRVAEGPSSVKFTVSHMVFASVEGKFKTFDGTVVTRTEDFSDAQVDATIDARSIYTGNKDRDQHLMSKEFFSAAEFPRIIFTSQSIARIDDATYQITGTLTMHGVTQPIVLTATASAPRRLADGRERMDVNAAGSVNRSDFGMKWNQLVETGNVLVGEKVAIAISAALIKEDRHIHPLSSVEKSLVVSQATR